jgi:hypothetical protein
MSAFAVAGVTGRVVPGRAATIQQTLPLLIQGAANS